MWHTVEYLCVAVEQDIDRRVVTERRELRPVIEDSSDFHSEGSGYVVSDARIHVVSFCVLTPPCLVFQCLFRWVLIRKISQAFSTNA